MRRRRPGWVVSVAAGVVLIAAAAAGAVLLRGAPAPSPAGNEPIYADTGSLEGRAGHIVRATVRATRAQDRDGTPETVATVEVSRAAKGDVPPDRLITVVYTTPGPDVAEAPAAFTVGQEYVFLLERPGAAGNAHLVNTTHGWYALRDGEAVPGEDNAVRLSRCVPAELGLR